MLDEPTIMTMLGIASLTASAMFFTLHAFARSIAGVRLWALGCLAVGFATLLDGPRVIQTWQLASLFFNIPFSIGQALFLVGTLQFLGRRQPRYLVPLLLALPTLLTVLFTFVIADSVTRIFTLSLYQAGVNGMTAWLLWRYAEPVARRPYLLASAVTFAQAAAALAQALLVAWTPVAISYAAPELPVANFITWAGTTLNVVVGNWILFLLIILQLVTHLNALAGKDVLTGLLNRRGLRAYIDSLLQGAPGRRSIGVLLLDIDFFKQINDRYGHEAGDTVLASMGACLRELSSADIVACRWGGEEFCVVATDLADEQLFAFAHEIRRRFHQASSGAAGVDGATVSIGVASAALDGTFEFSKLVAQADAHLYRAKENGRDRVAGPAA